MDWNKEYNSYRYYCIGFLLLSSKLQSFNVNFIRDFNEKINGLTDSSFISNVLIMDDFNQSIRDRQVHKHRLFGVRKTCNSESCNSAENRSSEGKCCKAEQNKYTDICEINNLKILSWNFGFLEDANLLSLIIRIYGDALCTADECINDNNTFDFKIGVKDLVVLWDCYQNQKSQQHVQILIQMLLPKTKIQTLV